MSEGKLQLFEFLRTMDYKGRALMLNPNKVISIQQLQQALLRGDRYLDDFDDEVRDLRMCNDGHVLPRSGSRRLQHFMEV